MGSSYETYKDYHITLDLDNMIIHRPENGTGIANKIYQIDDSEKNMLRLARSWIDNDIVSRMPAPPISELVWIPVTDRYPEDSRQVLIREGNNIATAHWFGFGTFNYKTREWDKTTDEPNWANQHHVLHGSQIDNPTHWMDTSKLLAIPDTHTHNVFDALRESDHCLRIMQSNDDVLVRLSVSQTFLDYTIEQNGKLLGEYRTKLRHER